MSQDATLAYEADPAQAVPFSGGRKCYACDAKPVGYADRRFAPEGELVPACKRHANPTIKIYRACALCLGRAAAGSLDVDGEFVHVGCHREASRS